MMGDKQFCGKNFYEVLGVDPDATHNEIRKMYQALALKVGSHFLTHLRNFVGI